VIRGLLVWKFVMWEPIFMALSLEYVVINVVYNLLKSPKHFLRCYFIYNVQILNSYFNRKVTWINSPFGHLHCLMLSGEAEANMYNFGWRATALTDFLWCVRVHMDLPAARSQSRTVWSFEPVMIWGSVAWQTTLLTVDVCPTSVWMLTFVLE